LLPSARQSQSSRRSPRCPVSTSGHLAGNGFTLADIDLLPILYYLQKYPEGEAMVNGAKNLTAYFAKHSERPCYKATIPPPIPQR
jgi:glutathione S-transferase